MFFCNRTPGATISVSESNFANEVALEVDGVAVAYFTEEGRIRLRQINRDFEVVSPFLALNVDGYVVVENEGGVVQNPVDYASDDESADCDAVEDLERAEETVKHAIPLPCFDVVVDGQRIRYTPLILPDVDVPTPF